MRFLLLLLAALTFSSPQSWASCVKEVDFSDEAKLQAEIDNAYFIGFVQGVYYQEYPNGTFKEAGIKPFMVYRADPNLDLSQTIVIKGDEIEEPEVGSYACEFELPRKNAFAEVVLVKDDEGVKLFHDFLTLTEYFKKYREKIWG
ncbi:MAG: hypothetical protein KA099_04360 [Alphaproteobacteria bacterium]|nr:hypothetical protein [Alphaproteobacteria bacterium]MBP7759062.1 hypothetical protein [Alphaproteobacteria bacterium]MBP7762426.1 hypothetical protein [Alphaproteobacteria bacterium]MBP7904541.1 hypothetical protein [Alphaproteobacteria bacterium]